VSRGLEHRTDGLVRDAGRQIEYVGERGKNREHAFGGVVVEQPTHELLDLGLQAAREVLHRAEHVLNRLQQFPDFMRRRDDD